MDLKRLLLLLAFVHGILYSNEAQSSKGQETHIKGLVLGLKEGQKVTLVHSTVNHTIDTISSTRINNKGRFELKGQIRPDIYTLHIANRSVPILLCGGEKVEVFAAIANHLLRQYDIRGSFYSAEMESWKNNLSTSAIAAYLRASTSPKPLLHLYLLQKLEINKHIGLYEKIYKELKKAYPYAHYTRQLKAAIKTEKKAPKAIVIGQKAPNIILPSPSGKKMTLSKLKGKVVLVDFWASWCKPCRIKNPYTIRLYNTYKDKKFDIYSISLDGMDLRQEARFGLNTESMENRRSQLKDRWTEAIEQDGLIWKNHVSELKNWDSKVVSLYQINSIPATFLLDKKGIVRYINLHGNALEKAVQELLAE